MFSPLCLLLGHNFVPSGLYSGNFKDKLNVDLEVIECTRCGKQCKTVRIKVDTKPQEDKVETPCPVESN